MSIVERLQRTSKDTLHRYFTPSSYRYIDELRNVVDSYNNSAHSTKFSLADVTEQCQEQVWNNQYHRLRSV